MAADKRNQRRVVRIAKSAGEAHLNLRQKYGLTENEFFESDIRRAYLDGLHAAVSDQVLEYLERKHGTQARVASVLGVDRSTVSKMKQNRSVPARYVGLVLASNGFAIEREQAQRSGLIAATYYVRTRVMRDESCHEPMSEGEFTELACGQQTDWYEAFILALVEVEEFVQE